LFAKKITRFLYYYGKTSSTKKTAIIRAGFQTGSLYRLLGCPKGKRLASDQALARLGLSGLFIAPLAARRGSTRGVGRLAAHSFQHFRPDERSLTGQRSVLPIAIGSVGIDQKAAKSEYKPKSRLPRTGKNWPGPGGGRKKLVRPRKPALIFGEFGMMARMPFPGFSGEAGER
jgi:hypothetical protein